MNVTISGQIHLASNVVFEPDTKYLYVSSDSYYLPNKQAMILSELAKCINKVVRYDRLCNILWGGVNADFYSTQLRKHVSRLNVLLKDKTKLKIYNIRNSGYSLKNVEP
jgi:DNA-binding winged helix-turn-helix (wHTH) protein